MVTFLGRFNTSQRIEMEDSIEVPRSKDFGTISVPSGTSKMMRVPDGLLKNILIDVKKSSNLSRDKKAKLTANFLNLLDSVTMHHYSVCAHIPIKLS